MRRLSIWLALVSLSSIVLAQTNAPTQVRRLSLQDAIQLTLQHNLDLQIDRYNPQISLYNLKGSYGAYDPTVNFTGQHERSETGPQLLQGGFVIAGNTSDANTFDTSLQGITPIGTSYTLSGRARDVYGSSGQLTGQSPF